MSSETPLSSDPLFGNNTADLICAAMAPSSRVQTDDPRAWQPPTPENLQARLGGAYEVQLFLARGGMGAVYRGIQASLERSVAIKILPPQLRDSDSSFALRFKQEARAMAQLNHPGIVSVYDFGEMADGTLYYVMEFIDGTDVGQMVQEQGRIASAHAMAITAHVCDALHYAHENGVVHRDIKPANIMVGYNGSVKVADFGLAKSSRQQNASLTLSGHVMGTLNFVAPEALTLGMGIDHRADIYAVGVMLYQMLTGKLPQGLFEMPSMQVPGLDPRYDAIVAGAMREDREQRYQKIRDMRHALDAILTQPVQKASEALRTNLPAPAARGPRAVTKTGRVKQTYAGNVGWFAAAIVISLGGLGWLKLKRPGSALPAAAPLANAAALETVLNNRCNPAERLAMMMRTGGDRNVERAVIAAFEFLKAKQNRDGSWGDQDRVGMTALALQAFAGRCETIDSSYYRDAILKGLLFLIETGKKNSDGLIASDSASPHAAAEHGMATDALGQMYQAARMGSSSLPGMREVFEKAVRFIIRSRTSVSGGTRASIFTLAWQCEALRTAKLTGLEFEGMNECATHVASALRSLQSAGGGFEAAAPETPQAITGACLRVLQLFPDGDPSLLEDGIRFAREHFQKEPLNWASMELQSVLFYTRAFYHRGGDDWLFWNNQMLPQMLACMKPDGSVNGHQSVFMNGKEIENTALAVLIFETYYRGDMDFVVRR
ncbi:protein kinase domain-containing protein [Prosthecobacter sp.]|uniref:serine/threonine-protein kinase n=1 Tax=Prosthecobacter sp. TaxID=1965333 RepID=UPI003783E777